MIQSMTNMVKALKKEFPESHIEISKKFRSYTHQPNPCIIDYGIYVENVMCKNDLNFRSLQIKVDYLLNNEAKND